MADLASFSLSDRRAAPHSRAHQYRLTAVSPNGWARGREGGREGREGREGTGGEGRGGAGRAGQGRGGEGRAGQGGEGRGRGGEGEGRGRGLSTLSTNQNLCDRGA